MTAPIVLRLLIVAVLVIAPARAWSQAFPADVHPDEGVGCNPNEGDDCRPSQHHDSLDDFFRVVGVVACGFGVIWIYTKWRASRDADSLRREREKFERDHQHESPELRALHRKWSGLYPPD